MDKKFNHKYCSKNNLIKNAVVLLKIYKREAGSLFSLLFKIKFKFIYDEASVLFALLPRAGVLSLLDMSVKTPIRTNYFNPGIAGYCLQSKTR